MNLFSSSEIISRFELGLAILAFIALPTVALAGDLGAADLGSDQLEKNVGTLNDWNPRVLNVQYKDGRMSVNGSIGIIPSQVQYFQRGRYQLYVFYKDIKGKPSVAGFNHAGYITAASFFEDFLNWWVNSE